MAVNTHLKKDRNWGIKRDLAPLGCLRLRGREGVTLAIALKCVVGRFSIENELNKMLVME
jgi:hypothetical protein